MNRDAVAAFGALFWQCLAKAYLPPRDGNFVHALQREWPGLLGELASRIGLAMQADIDEIAMSVRDNGDPQALLITYSRLFLAPPVAAPLTLGNYLDTSAFGGSGRALDALYLKHGLESSAAVLKDNPDHLARVLEFTGFLFAKDAGTPDTDQPPADQTAEDLAALRKHYLLRALPEMLRRVTDAETLHHLPCIYSRILALTLSAVRDHEGLLFEDKAMRSDEEDYDNAAEEPAKAQDFITCGNCGSPIIAAPEMQVIADRLRMAGLPTDHLKLCPDCRDSNQGWQRARLNPDLPGFQ